MNPRTPRLDWRMPKVNCPSLPQPGLPGQIGICEGRRVAAQSGFIFFRS
jgi:hypothetical protein